MWGTGSDFAESVYSSTQSVIFWGPDREANAIAAYAVASRHSASPVWLDIRDPGRAPDQYEKLLGVVSPKRQRLFSILPDELAPETAMANAATWELVRSDEPNEKVMQLVDFLRLPLSVQGLFDEMAPLKGPRCFLATNVDRIAMLYPEDEASTRGYNQVFRDQSVKLVSTLCGLVRKDRFAYDYVFRIDPTPGKEWRDALLTAEKGAMGGKMAGVDPTPLRKIRGITELLQRAPGGSA